MLTVLIATDGSRGAGHSLELAQQLLAGKEADITVLHVIPRHLLLDPRAGPIVAETFDQSEARRTAEAVLASCVKQLQDAGVSGTIRQEIEIGDPADIILTLAEQRNTDVIVVGSHGTTALQRFARGSVATKVATHAHCAVLIGHHQKGTGETPTVEEQASGRSAS